MSSFFNYNNFRDYFQYEDKLRRTVSKITGILIIIYCFLSGILVNNVLLHLVFGYIGFVIVHIIILILSSLLTAIFFLKLEIKIVNLLISNTSIDKYTYIRLLLFVSIIIYILVMTFFYLFKVLFSLSN